MMKSIQWKIGVCLFLIPGVISFSCKTPPVEETIKRTSENVTLAIKKGSSKEFINYIGLDLRSIGKNEEIIDFDIQKIKRLFEKYASNGKSVEVTDMYNALGIRLVKVPIISKPGDSANVYEMHLALHFGPREYVSYDKISGYEIVVNNSDSATFFPIEYWQKKFK